MIGKYQIVVKKHSDDICECGDYRQHHVDGTGACKICKRNINEGTKPCRQFRLAFDVSKLTGNVRPSKDELEKAINESGLV